MRSDEYKNIIIGSGYSGLNAYYEIRDKKNTLLIDSDGNFQYHSKLSDISIRIPQARKETVERINLDNYSVQTESREYRAENIVIATGCNRKDQIKFMENGSIYKNFNLASANEFDDYILLQYVMRLNKTGIRAGYSGSFMKYFGEDVAMVVKDFLITSDIPVSSEPDFIFPECKPRLFNNFLKVDRNFMVKEGIYAVGDIIESNIKSGELSMRQGAFVGKHINGNMDDFKPVFITILNNFNGLGMRIKSEYPWGSKEYSIHTGYVYSLMPRFLETYYRLRKGKMGIISSL